MISNEMTIHFYKVPPKDVECCQIKRTVPRVKLNRIAKLKMSVMIKIVHKKRSVIQIGIYFGQSSEDHIFEFTGNQYTSL